MARDYEQIDDGFDPVGFAQGMTGESVSPEVAAKLNAEQRQLEQQREKLEQERRVLAGEPEPIAGLETVPETQLFPDKAPKKTISNAFKNLVPPSDSLYVYKVSREGSKGIIGRFSASDLNRSQSLEMHIKDYVVPVYGPGDYIVEVKGMDGKTKQAGMINIPAPIAPKDSSTSLKDLLLATQAMQRDAEQKSKGQMQELVAMMGLFKEFLPKGEGKSGGSMDMMMPMMMFMMMQKPQGPDPMVQMLLQKLMAREEQPQLPPPIPMPFMNPAPPPHEAGAGLGDIIKILGETMRAAQPQTQQNDLTQLLLKTLVSKDDHNSLTPKDLVNMIPMIKDLFGSKDNISTFNEQLEILMKLDELRGERSNSEDKSMWAGLAEMVVGVARDIKMRQMELEMLPKNKTLPVQQRTSLQVRPRQSASTAVAAPTQDLQQPTERPKQKIPEIPISFRKFAYRMKEANAKDDEPALIMAFMEGLLHLRETSAEWAPYIEEMMLSAAKGDKKKALRFVEVFLFSFAKKGLISAEVVGVTMKVIDMNWDSILEKTGISRALQDEPGEPPVESKAASGNGDEEPANVEVEDESEAEDDSVDPADYGIKEEDLAASVSPTAESAKA